MFIFFGPINKFAFVEILSYVRRKNDLTCHDGSALSTFVVTPSFALRDDLNNICCEGDYYKIDENISTYKHRKSDHCLYAGLTVL